MRRGEDAQLPYPRPHLAVRKANTLDGLGARFLALGPFLFWARACPASTHVLEKRPDIGATVAADLASSHRHLMRSL
jgi:hypothetical protein